MKRLFFFALLVPLAAADVLAQQDCLSIHDRDKRLKCYDQSLRYEAPEKPAAEQPQPVPGVKITIRDKADFNNFAGAELGSKPGQFNLQHIDGKDSSTVRLGAIAAFRAINDLGWQPFAALAWNRDTAAKTPKDNCDIALGITGPLWDAYDYGWTLFPTLRAIRRVDTAGSGDATIFDANINIVKLSWVNSVPGADRNSYQFVPHVGLLHERRLTTGVTHGNWQSVYGGLTFSSQLNGFVPRLSSVVTYQRFSDQSVPGRNSSRHDEYAGVTFEYALTDPADKSIRFRPSLTLTREVGTDIKSGGAAVNKTTFGIGLRLN